jgi:autotransporter strand-loop-strand O-heptosyltransferase
MSLAMVSQVKERKVPPAPEQKPPAPAAPEKRAYPDPAAVPTQEGPRGIRFDFNAGARVTVGEKLMRIRLFDLNTGNIVFETPGATAVRSTKRYFIRFRIEVWDEGKSVFRHDYSAAGREILVQFSIGALGDTVGWFPYAVKFKEHHGCRLTCAMSGAIIPLFRDAYPDISFVTHEEVRPEKFYATYCLGPFKDAECVWQPCDFRLVGLHRTAGYILGVALEEVPPRLALADESRPIPEPYVCIATQASSQAKYWNNPYGWHRVVAHLKERGFRIICVDQKRVHGQGQVWNHIPQGAEDIAVGENLAGCARWLRHAECFVGLSSGLSWLAWAADTPVVMISGFTHPTTEFATPYRVINYHTCNSCFNDVRETLPDHSDFLCCPRHKNTPRQFECTRLITPEQVITALGRVPAIAARSAPFRQIPKKSGAEAMTICTVPPNTSGVTLNASP